jgi:prolyl-tRNA synthetase
MRYSKTLIPTLKEAPHDAIMPSHIYLLRAGYARMVGAGIYELLPLGYRVLRKIEQIVREEMDRAGALEVLMPALLPSDYFKETGRWESFGDTLFRLKDRKGAECHLGPTHEEIITDMARREVRSYRNLPINLYQIQTKFRDEPRPRGGLLRGREFIMKDAYSFDATEENAKKSYETMRDAYHRIFRRMGLNYRMVAADSGAMGGSSSAEFQVLTSTGEDAMVACSSCDYAANLEVAVGSSADQLPVEASDMKQTELVATPNARSIEEVIAFLGQGVTAERMLKSLVYRAADQLVMVVIRGDHAVNEIKLARILGTSEAALASEAEVEAATGAPLGFAGPVGYIGRIVADRAVVHVLNGVTGANQKDAHLLNVNFSRDFKAELADLRTVTERDKCPKCQANLQMYRGIEAGHIFVLGTHYSAKMGALYQDENGDKKPLVMGCYGIGVSRLIAAVIEQHHDDKGICWPVAVAPYQVIITPLNTTGEPMAAAERLYGELMAKGVEVLLDDRAERPGVKFNDADLIGIPIRVTIGDKSLRKGEVEVKGRRDNAPQNIAIDACAEKVMELVTSPSKQ